MAISVSLTLVGGATYDVSNYVKRYSIEVDEYLFNPENLKANTNGATFTLFRKCPYIDDIFAWTGDISVAISNDGTPCFTGYVTDNYALKISCYGGSDISFSCEDPGIKKLKTDWVSADALVTSFSGKKVCDPADTENSFVHILAGLAGVTLSSSLPTISDLVYFTIQDKDTRQYWEILEGVLYDFMYTFYFDASGNLCLFSFNELQGTSTQTVRSDATILQKSVGDTAIQVQKRLIQYKQVNVEFSEAGTLATALVYRDTTGGGTTDCDIEIAAGAYYPTSCDASTYAFIDYFLEDGRDILAVGSVSTAGIVVDSGITFTVDNLGTSARIRFLNTAGIARHIRQLKITGTSVIAVTADSKVTSTLAGGKKLTHEAKYLTTVAEAQNVANLLRYFYANSGSLYTFRAYHGTLYPSAILFPSETLYPLGDLIGLGELVNLKDPLWTGLNINCGVYRKKYTVGKAGATFDAVGIGTITLSDAVGHYPVVQIPNTSRKYPAEKALTTLSDTVDFVGQYGVYGGQRYIGSGTTTWALDDAGQ